MTRLNFTFRDPATIMIVLYFQHSDGEDQTDQTLLVDLLQKVGFLVT